MNLVNWAIYAAMLLAFLGAVRCAYGAGRSKALVEVIDAFKKSVEEARVCTTAEGIKVETNKFIDKFIDRLAAMK